EPEQHRDREEHEEGRGHPEHGPHEEGSNDPHWQREPPAGTDVAPATARWANGAILIGRPRHVRTRRELETAHDGVARRGRRFEHGAHVLSASHVNVAVEVNPCALLSLASDTTNL